MEPSSSPVGISRQLHEIGQYRVVSELTAGQSWLASAPGSRPVVLKLLDEDCLWKNQLHPSVRDRLARVRELAHTGVANLHGVERDAGLGMTFLVWEHVEGRTLDAAARTVATREFLVLVRELLLSIDMLHARGIIHGAVKAQNVIVGPDGRIALTHISPLLYSEVEQDSEALWDLLAGLLEQRGAPHGALARLVQTAREKQMPLRQVAGRVGAIIEARDSEVQEADEQDRVQSRHVRRRTLAGAVATAMLALALFGALRLYAQRQTPRPPVPPTAPAAAMQDKN